MIVELYVPCEIFTVEVKIGPGEGLSPLELLVVRAIHLGYGSFESLAGLLQLGHRPVLDLIRDLWSRSHVKVDLAENRIFLSQHVADIFEETDPVRRRHLLRRLEGGETSADTVDLARELLTGHLLPVPSGPLADGAKLVPPILDDGSYRDASPEELMATLTRHYARRQRHSLRPSRLLSAHFSLHNEQVVGTRRHTLLVRAAVRRTESDRLAFDITDRLAFSSLVRQDLERALSEQAERYPSQDCFKEIWANALRARGQPPSEPAELAEQLVQRTSALDVVFGPQVQTTHEALCTQAEAAHTSVRRRVQGMCRVSALSDQRRIRDQLAADIGDAERQIVMGCGSITASALSSFIPVLQKRLKRAHDRRKPIDIYILWGRDSGDTLPSPVKEMLLSLSSSFRGSFHWSELPSRSNASFLVRDGRFVTLTTLPFLALISDSGAHLSVRLERKDAFACGPAIELLAWARRTFPDHRAAEEMQSSVYEFAMKLEEETEAQAIFDPVGQFLPPAEPSTELLNAVGDYHTAAVNAWREQWRVWALDLAKQLQIVIPAGELVVQHSHRDLVWNAIRTFEQRLVIASERLSREGANGPLLQALEERLERPGQVAILFGASTDEVALSRLRKLESSRRGRVYALKCDLKVNALVWDDNALVTSYGLLGAGGLPQRAGRIPGVDMGMVLRGGGAADLILDVFRALPEVGVLQSWKVWPQRENRHFERAEDVGRERRRPPPCDDGLQRLLARLHRLDRAQALARYHALYDYLEAHVEPGRRWEALDLLSRASTVPDELEAATAMCLSMPHLRRDRLERSYWLRRLAEPRWTDGRFHETAILLAGLDPDMFGPRLPSLPVAELAALAASSAPMGKAIDPFDGLLAGRLSYPHEATAMSCFALPRVLFEAHEVAWMALEESRSAVEPALRAWIELSLTFREQDHRPLPVAHIGRRGQSDRIRQTLRKQLERASQAGFTFQLGYFTWRRLFEEEGEMAKLARLVDAGDVSGTQNWLARHPSDDAAEHLLDVTSRAVAHERALLDDQIIAGKRQALLGRIEPVFQEARKWVAAEKEDALGNRRIEPRIQELLSRVRDSAPAIRRWHEQLKGAQRPEAPLVRLLLDQLSPVLVEWSR